MEEQDNVLNGYIDEGGSGIDSVVGQYKSKKQPSYGQMYRRSAAQYSQSAPYTEKLSDVIGPSDYGSSIYDEDITQLSQLDDLEDTRANIQPFIHKFGVGVGTFASKTATATAGGIGNLFYGTYMAFHDGKLRSFYDNDYMNALEGVNEDIDSALKIYQSDSSRNGDFWDQTFGSSHFWLKSVLGDGLSFTAGAVLSAYALGGVGGLVGKMAQAAKVGDRLAYGAGATLNAVGFGSKNVSKVANILKSGLSKSDDAAQLLRLKGLDNIKSGISKGVGLPIKMAAGTGYEASVEALQFIKEAKENKHAELMDKYGELDTPEKIESYNREMTKFNDDVENTGNAVFTANAALVGASHLVTLPTIFGRGVKSAFSGSNKFIEKTVDATGKTVLKYAPKEGIKGAARIARSIVKPMVFEGLVEEGGQGLVNRLGIDYVGKQYDEESANTQYDFIKSFGESFQDAYGSLEGWKEITAGIIIGSLGAPNFRSTTKENDKGERVKVKKKIWSKNAEESWWTGGWGQGIQDDYADGLKAQHTVKNQKTPQEVFEYLKANKGNTLLQTQNNINGYQHQVKSNEELKSALNDGDFFSAKNSQADILFQHTKSREDSGYGDLIESEVIDPILEMDVKQFNEYFNYDSETTAENIDERRKDAAKKALDRIKKIRNAIKSADNSIIFDTSTDDGRLRRDLYIYSLATIDNVAERIDSIKESTTKTLSEHVRELPYEDEALDNSFIETADARVKEINSLLKSESNENVLNDLIEEKRKLLDDITSARNKIILGRDAADTTNILKFPNTVAGVLAKRNALIKNLGLKPVKEGDKIVGYEASPSDYPFGGHEKINDALNDLNDLALLMRRKEEAFELYETARNNDAFEKFATSSRLMAKRQDLANQMAEKIKSEQKAAEKEAKESVDNNEDPKDISEKTGLSIKKVNDIIADKETTFRNNLAKEIKKYLGNINAMLDAQSLDPIQNLDELLELVDEMLNDDNPSNDELANAIVDMLTNAEAKARAAAKEAPPKAPTVTPTVNPEDISSGHTETPSSDDENSNKEYLPENEDTSTKLVEAAKHMAYLAMNYIKSVTGTFKDAGINKQASRDVLDFRNLTIGSDVSLTENPNADVMIDYEGKKTSWLSIKDSLKDGEYSDLVPIEVVYNGNVVGYLHATTFMNPNQIVESYNIGDVVVDNIDEQINNIRRIRAAVISSEGKTINTKVKDTSFGKIVKGDNVKTSEAFKSDEVKITLVHDGILAEGESANELKKKSGPVALIPVKKAKNGVIINLAMPLMSNNLAEEQSSALGKVFDLWLKSLTTKENAEEFNKANKSVEAAMAKVSKVGSAGIKSVIGVRNFFGLLIHPKTFTDGFTAVNTNTKSDAYSFALELDVDGHPIIGIGQSFDMKIFKVISREFLSESSIIPGLDSFETKWVVQELNSDGKFVDAEMSIDDLSMIVSENFKSMKFNSNKSLVGKSISTPYVDPSGNLAFKESKSYGKVIAENTSTNIKATNIGTKSAPKYIYAVQRNIELDTDGLNPEAVVESGIEETPTQQLNIKRPKSAKKTEASKSTEVKGKKKTRAEIEALEAKVLPYYDIINLDDSISFDENNNVVDSRVEALKRPLSNLGGKVSQFMRSLNKEQQATFRAYLEMFKIKCK